ncbi:hypothetical protein C8R44DRAFT_984739 [Mycena epipterygia]|nr:hypothetical protein C8R44DRAFT_984739 [Mycena epipterygia]
MEQTQSTAALPSIQSPDWRSPTPSSPPPYIALALIPDRDLLARYGDFEHRVWLTWYSMQVHMPWSASRASWLAIIGGTDPHGDLWLWEDGDEEQAKALRDKNYGYQITIPKEDLVDAFRALEARIRKSWPPAQNVLAHLSPQTRVGIISWLIVAGPLRQSRLKSGDYRMLNFTILLKEWATMFCSRSLYPCNRCQISLTTVRIWAEIMLQVHSVEDLVSIQWSRGCNCLKSQLTAPSAKPEIPLEKNSVAFRILYGLVCSPWLLILWVAFRTIRSEADPLPEFLEILRNDSSHAELFFWDDKDHMELMQHLDWPSAIHPDSWGQYMVEIPLKDWQLIRNLTWIPWGRSRRSDASGHDNLNIRLAALFLTYSTSPFIAPDNVLAPLGISLDNSIFASMARAINRNETDHTTPANFDSPDFWASPKLESWLTDRSRSNELFHAVWQNIPGPSKSVFQRVESLYHLLTALPQNWDIHTRPFNGGLKVTPIRPNHILELLKGCTFVLAQFKFLRVSYQNPVDSRACHIISKALYVQTSGAIAGIIVLCLRNPESYKEFLACSRTEAQELLDLLQDKVGEQVAAGGFGDIWKGSFRGQNVSVKVMRLFEDSDVEAVLKAFGREAVIWRQLSHPNLLPFCGVYYLEKRLCLISPWMENGNILKFLNKESHNIDRLSLILDVALGLEYLHENHVVHGDLKALNILVTPSRRACIVDFGLASITDVMTVRFTHSTAPELFEGEKADFGSDVYAFSYVCYEILTGKVPFHELPNDMAVILHVLKGKRLSQPSSSWGISESTLDSLWELLEDCWKEMPDKRPTAAQIVERLKSPLIQATTTQSTTDWNEQFSSKFRRSLQVQPLLPSVPQIERMIFGDESDEACKECFPDQESSEAGNAKSPTTSPSPSVVPQRRPPSSGEVINVDSFEDDLPRPAQRRHVEPSREVIELLSDSDDEPTVETGPTGGSRDVGLQGSNRQSKHTFEEGSNKNLNQPRLSAKKIETLTL